MGDKSFGINRRIKIFRASKKFAMTRLARIQESESRRAGEPTSNRLLSNRMDLLPQHGLFNFHGSLLNLSSWLSAFGAMAGPIIPNPAN